MDPSDPLSFMDISLDDDPTPAPSLLPAPSSSSVPRASPTTTVGATSASRTNMDHANTPRFLRWMIHMGLVEASPSSWETAFIQMQSTFELNVQAHPYPDMTTTTEEGEQNALDGNQADTATFDLDPLTAMVQATESEEKRLAAMDLEYRKAQALRNRGKAAARLLPESEEYDEELATLQVIDKDLARLANPHHDGRTNSNNNSNDSEETAQKVARKELLRQVLFVYHCENNDPGYRQGMHEIASYLLFALELDNSGKIDAEYQASLTYHLLEKVLHGMAAAYDVQNNISSKGTATVHGSNTLQLIGRRVDHIVRTHDPLLGQRLAKLQVPPQMYFTKWIRLLFAREVNEVLEFWDEAFFNDQITATQDFMPLLEAWTAARLLVWSAHFMSIRDEGQLLQTLMNLPVEPETHIWCQVARDLLNKRGQSLSIPGNNKDYRPPLEAPPPPPAAAAPSGPLPSTLLPNSLKAPSVAPFKSFLSEAGTGKHLGGWMEQISSKTQILGQRVKQEWEQIAAAAANPDPQHIYQQQAQQRSNNDSGMGYNITYRAAGEEPPMYDPPVPAPAAPPIQQQAPRPLTRNAICKRLDQSTATLHAYLMQQQQASGQIPATVWQALADMQKLSRELRPRNAQS